MSSMILASNCDESRQVKTSRSSKFQSAKGSTRVPTLGETSISRLADKFLTASRMTVRLTP